MSFYGVRMTCTCGVLSPFHWRFDKSPTVFAADRSFTPNVHGESQSQTSARSVQEFEKKTGRSRGSITGISQKSDKAIDESRDLMAKRRRSQ
jgi:hypothetical protein